MKRSRGFTLLELLITIAIVGVLAGIAVPQYGNHVRKAKIAGVVSTLRVYVKNVQAELMITGVAPLAVDGIPKQGGSSVFGPSTKYIEGFRYDGNDNEKTYWFVARVTRDVVDQPHWYKREIHYGFTQTSSGAWVAECGRWSPNHGVDPTLLLQGCNSKSVEAVLP